MSWIAWVAIAIAVAAIIVISLEMRWWKVNRQPVQYRDIFGLVCAGAAFVVAILANATAANSLIMVTALLLVGAIICAGYAVNTWLTMSAWWRSRAE